MWFSLVSSTHGPKTMPDMAMHQGGSASLFVALI